jgi:hypothetical protein
VTGAEVPGGGAPAGSLWAVTFDWLNLLNRLVWREVVKVEETLRVGVAVLVSDFNPPEGMPPLLPLG